MTDNGSVAEPGRVDAVRPHAGTPRDQVDAARALRDLGYSRLWLSEVAGLDAVALGGRLRAAVPDLPLVVGPLPAPLRTAPQLGMVAATLADGPGDLELVLGASSPAVTEGWHGRGRTRVRQLRALLETYGAVVDGERTSSVEPSAPSHGFVLRAVPAYRVPIGLAALGPRTRALAATHADRLVLNFTSPQLAAAYQADLAQTAAAAGRATVPPVTVWLHVADGTEDSLIQCRRFLARYVQVPGYRESFAAQGFGELMDKVRDAGGFDTVVSLLPDEFVSHVIRLGGSSDVRRAVEQYTGRGMDVALACPLGRTADGLQVLQAAADALDLRRDKPGRRPTAAEPPRARTEAAL